MKREDKKRSKRLTERMNCETRRKFKASRGIIDFFFLLFVTKSVTKLDTSPNF